MTILPDIDPVICLQLRRSTRIQKYRRFKKSLEPFKTMLRYGVATHRLCTPLEWLLLCPVFVGPRWFCGSNSQLGTATSSAMESFSWQVGSFNLRHEHSSTVEVTCLDKKNGDIFLTPRDQRKRNLFPGSNDSSKMIPPNTWDTLFYKTSKDVKISQELPPNKKRRDVFHWIFCGIGPSAAGYRD